MTKLMRNEFVLTVYVQPGAKKPSISGRHNGYIKVKLNAPPVDGKANQALIAFLANIVGVSKSSIELISGEKSRIKKVKIIAKNEEYVLDKLLNAKEE